MENSEKKDSLTVKIKSKLSAIKTKTSVHKSNPCLVGLLSGLLLLLGGICLIVTGSNETIIHRIVSEQFQLDENNTKILPYWENFPYDMKMDFYLWNVTNAYDVLHHRAKPNLTEVGPFTYTIDIERRSIEFDQDSASYTNYQHYTLSPDSMNDTVMITTANGPYMFVERIKTRLPTWLRAAIDLYLSKIHYKPLVTKSASELIWGYEDELIKFVHDKLPSLVPFSKFGYYLGQNATESGKFTVDNGAEDITRLMEIKSYKDRTTLGIWPTESANMINGTDSFGFAPLQFDTTELYVFADVMCRSLALQREERDHSKFVLDFDVFNRTNTTPDFCIGDSCPLDGIMNLTSCLSLQFGQELPIAATFPYLYNVDTYYKDQIDGIDFDNVDQNAFKTAIQMDPLTGLVYTGTKTMQLNVFFPTSAIYQTTSKEMLLPILWFSETATMSKHFKNSVTFKALLPLYTLYYSHFVLFFSSFGLFIFSSIFIYRSCRSVSDYTELPQEDQPEESEDCSNENEENDQTLIEA